MIKRGQENASPVELAQSKVVALVSVIGRESVNVSPLPYSNSHPAGPARNVLNLAGNVTGKEVRFHTELNTLDGARRKQNVSSGKRTF